MGSGVVRPKAGLSLFRTVLAIVFVLLVASCGGSSRASTPMSGVSATPDGRFGMVITTKGGLGVPLRVEVARTAEEKAKGLSGRKSLDEDAGMLFDIPVRGGGFSMKDTSIPLSVAFIEKCGRIVDIADLQPNDEALRNSPVTYRFGLEVNQGWFARAGVSVGDAVSLPPELRQAGC